MQLATADANWPAQFEAAAAPLRTVFGSHAGTLEHIGSTAVPGLCAKPVLDVLLGVAQLSDVAPHHAALAALGYRYRPEHERELPERRYFTRDADTTRLRVHLHVVVNDSTFWREHLAFRDALRADHLLAARYAELKRQLAAEHADDKAAYTEAKGPFIRAVLASLNQPPYPR
ncbi:GrpB family protein [Roseateles cellulosilyticus]|uniref:GrpB family protein n=1 Tax=Pelomonas cellulosilytica TaxID=2906762 RepID=A0ABS8XM24_9BURK|nr:GrpB family protein [Pelomonas sp. P8]